MTVLIAPSTEGPVSTTVRVGAYLERGSQRPSSVGPLGSEWQMQSEQRPSSDGRARTVNLYYQEISADLYEHAIIRIHGGVDIPCHRATSEQLNIMDATLQLVPPSHLERVLRAKPEGFLISSTTGRAGGSLSYTGGLNAGANYRETPNYNEMRLILITYGALWRRRSLGICPTVLHEIGHVMTRRSEINYNPFPEDRRRALGALRVSRNPGALEALCNTYMYMLCYGSRTQEIHDFGSGRTNQNDRITRDALRHCPAFSSRLLSEEWRSRFEER
ncbi:MAG: hypothetical protein OES26_15110 [Gammaproteobacteria bacterium]|nr:hypothetical protein [Gammaproteobacteria bacterium]